MEPVFEIRFKEEESDDTQAVFEVHIIDEQIEIKNDPILEFETEERNISSFEEYDDNCEVYIKDEQIEIKDDPLPQVQDEERNITVVKEDAQSTSTTVAERIEIKDEFITDYRNEKTQTITDMEEKDISSKGGITLLAENETVCENDCSLQIRPLKTYSKSAPVKLWYKETEENIFEDVPEVVEKNLLSFTNDFVNNHSPKSWFLQREPGYDTHYSTYNGTSVFSCDKCNTDFLFKNDFFKHVRHLSRYEGEDKCSCHICGKQLLKKNLTKHTRKCHTNIKKKEIRKEQSLCEDVLSTEGVKQLPETEKECEGVGSPQIITLKLRLKSTLGKMLNKQNKNCTQRKINKFLVSTTKMNTKSVHGKSRKKENPQGIISEADAVLAEDSTKQSQIRIKTICEFCGKQLSHKHSLQNHIRSFHTIEGIKKRFKRKKTKHLCDICGLWCNVIKTHYIQSHSNKIKRKRKRTYNLKRFECQMCSKTFKQRSILKRHENIHFGIKNYICEICDLAFTYKSTLKNHESTFHTGYFPFVCNVCDSSFLTSFKLKQHQEIHSEDKKFICSLCGKKYVSQRYLTNHKNIAHKIFQRKSCKRNTCKFCGKVISHLALLIEHENQHVLNNKYVCDHCKKTFPSLIGLTCHIARNCKTFKKRRKRVQQTNESKEEKTFNCKTCGKRFATKHRSLHHLCVKSDNNPHICHTCEKYFSSHYALANHNLCSHYKEKQFKCNYCNKGFAFKIHLRNHVWIHTGYKPYVCNSCGKRFVQKSHLLTHKHVKSGVRPFSCDICGAAFNLKPSLRDHILLHLR